MNELKPFWIDASPEKKRELAKRMESSVAYLSQIAHGHARPGKHFRKLLVEEVNSMRSPKNL